jgi:hypothetical protein
VVNTPASYPGGYGLKSVPVAEVFLGFSHSLRADAGIVTENYATAASFHILSNSSFYSKLYNLSYWKSIFK